MFYCEQCRVKNNWPESFTLSRGGCEMCGETAPCYDVPSGRLPQRQKVDNSAQEIKVLKSLVRELVGVIDELRRQINECGLDGEMWDVYRTAKEVLGGDEI